MPLTISPSAFAVTFPPFDIFYVAPVNFEADNRIDRSVNGTGRARSFYTEAKGSIAVYLPALTQAEVDQLMAFFNTYMAEPFGIPWGCPEVLYSVIFVGAPQVTPLGAGLYSASLNVTLFP
jgi:hypothetical protein